MALADYAEFGEQGGPDLGELMLTVICGCPQSPT
jgi:hypothetical protein